MSPKHRAVLWMTVMVLLAGQATGFRMDNRALKWTERMRRSPIGFGYEILQFRVLEDRTASGHGAFSYGRDHRARGMADSRTDHDPMEASSVSYGNYHEPENSKRHVMDEEILEDNDKTITIIKKVAAPYPVERTIHYPVIKQVLYPVKVPVPQPYPIERSVPYPVKVYVKVPVKIPKPVPILKEVRYPVRVPVERPVPVKVYIPQPYPVEKKVHYKVEVPVPEPFPISKNIPVPVKVTEHVAQPYPVEKVVHYPVEVKVDKPIAVHVDKPYPVQVEKPVPYPVEKPVLYPVGNVVNYSARIPDHVDNPVKVYPDVKHVSYTVEVPGTDPEQHTDPR